MSLPLLGIGGRAKSGKDTVGGLIAERMDGVCIAQADPMKRLAAQVFDFSSETLWGPSEARNAVDDRYSGSTGAAAFNKALDILESETTADWGRELLELSEVGVGRLDDLMSRLRIWGRHLAAHHLQTGKPFTARYALQTLGTEVGRNFSKNIWTYYTRGISRQLLEGDCFYNKLHGGITGKGYSPPSIVIVTDLRFPNEATTIKAQGGSILRVDSPVAGIDEATQAAGVVNHASETSLDLIPSPWWDYIVFNDKTLGMEHLTDTVDKMLVYLRGEAPDRRRRFGG